MKTPIKKRLPSPARSQGAGPRTPIRHRHRRTLSVGSARSNASGRLTALIQQNRNMDSFAVSMSPLASRKSILSDNTEIEEPKRKSWWKKLGENSRDVTELFEENKNDEPNNIIEELDIEVLSQEKRNYTMDLPESSDSESINSIVIPQRKLFTQKENLPQKKFGQIIGTRETLAKLHKDTNVDKSIKVVTRELFQNNQRSKPIFPAALLNISPNKTAADKTKELATVEPKAQVRNIFGNRGTKRKNIFTNFIVSESEDEIPEIQPKVFGFQKKIEGRRRGSSSSRGLREPSPTSSITTDIEMDDWKMLPSSTMVEHQLEVMMADGNSPKRTRLSKLTEIESEGSSNATKQSNKSVQSKETRKSKTFTKEKGHEPNSIAEEIFGLDEESTNKTRKSKTFTKEKVSESSMTTRNKSKAQDENVEHLEQDQNVQNKSSKDTDKSRKSKTFTKEKVPEAETSQNYIEAIFDKNQEEQIDTDKSRKSKTFTKEKGSDLETSMKNKSTSSHNGEVIETQGAQNKSKSKIAELNISQSSIKTRSQSKANSPNNSQIIDDELTKNVETSNKNKSKSISVSPTNIETKTPSDVAEENDDEELNFTLEYETEEMPETIPNISNTNVNKARTSKSMTQQENSSNISKTNKTMPNKVIDESAEQESTQEKSIQSPKGNKSHKDESLIKSHKDEVEGEMTLNDKQTEQRNVLENNDDMENELQKSIENQSEGAQDKSHDELDQQEENEKSKNNDEIEHQNESHVENNDDSEIHNESEIERSQEQDKNIETSEVGIASENKDEPDNVSQEIEENNESQEVEEENEDQSASHGEIQNESDVHNASQEEDEEENEEEDEEQNISQEVDENEEDEEQNISQEVEENEVDQNVSEDEHNKSEVQNESQEVNEEENEEEDEEQNISQEEDEEEDEEQNISQQVDGEQIESEVDQESEANDDSDNDDEQNNQDDSDNNEIENDQEVVESGTDEIETPNISHDTTGRNRKKNESPEVILHDSNDHLDSFAVRGRNTSVRKTEMIKTLNIRPSLAPVRESTGFSDGSKNSSAEGSGWDSHRTTRKTLRQTFGRDFTPRKSLRALVMEKSAKRQTQHNDLASVTAKFPQANSTELPEMSNRFDDDQDENQEPNHEVSLRTRQTTLERYLQEIKKKNTETRLKMEEEVRNSLNAPSKDHIFKVPAKPLFARRQTKPTAKPKQTKSTLFLGELPAEVIEDLKYKPPKRFQPSNAPWITKRLYKFLESKLEAKYDYKARVRAEKLVEHIYHFAKDLRRHEVAASDAVDVLKREMARLDVVKTHFEFYEFFHQFMPREVRVKVVPDVVNKISLPRHGVFSDIL